MSTIAFWTDSPATFKSQLTHLIKSSKTTLSPALRDSCISRQHAFRVMHAKGFVPKVHWLHIFHDMIEKTMEVFMDDFSVFGDSFSSCLSHLDKMLQRFGAPLVQSYGITEPILCNDQFAKGHVSNRSHHRLLHRIARIMKNSRACIFIKSFTSSASFWESNLNEEVADTIVESLSPPPIPVADSDSLMEEIDLFLASDYSIPPGIESNYYDFEGDILFLKNLLNDDSPEVKSDHESDQSEMITFSPENDPLHYRFTGGIIPNLPRIARDHEEYLNMMTLLYEISNSQENLHANPSSIIDSLPTFPIEESSPDQEEIDLLLVPDDLTPPGVENDSEDEDVSTFLPDEESFSLNNYDDPCLPRPPPEPSDICLSFEPKTTIKKDFVRLNEDFNQGGRILSQNVKEDDSFTFIIWKFFSFLTFLKDSPLLLSLKSEDTIFDPGISTFHFLSKAGCISSGWNFHMFIQTFMKARLRFSLPFASPRTT
ncbi:hypothetical protein Tco_1563535 [Tanacetum coccineum]